MSGLAGSKVDMPCDISSKFVGDEVYLVLWYKDESSTPIYSVDARRVRLERARHSVIENLSPRAYFSTSSQPSVLELESLVAEDEGEYRCRVDFRKARTRHSTIYLQIIIPPSTPVIRDRNGEIQQGIIGPHNEGETLLLICESEGKPVPNLSWWKGTILLDDTYVVTSGNRVRNDLEITSLNRLDLMAMYICQASNNNISVPATSSVMLEMNFKPLEVKIEGNRNPLSANKSVEVVCITTGSRPPAILTWRKGNTKLKSHKDKVIASGSVTISKLLFTPTREDNGKFLYCRAENFLIPGSALEDAWKLTIYYVPQLHLRLGNKRHSSTVQEGSDIYFECFIRANPWIKHIGWKVDNREVRSNSEEGVIVSNQTLVLQKAERSKKGKYSCTATNDEGVGESNLFDLRVQFAPVCKMRQKTEYGALLHSAVNIPCEVEADPSNVSFRWEFNNTSTSLTILPFRSKGTRSIISHTPRGDEDFGTFYCWGKNAVGEQRHPCIYSLLPAEVPGYVENCSVNTETEHSLYLRCLEGEDGGLDQHFLMEIREASTSVLQINISSDTPNFLADGLPSGTTFTVTIYSVNAKGKSRPVTFRVRTLPSPISQTQKDDPWQLNGRPILVVLIGVVGGFAFLILVLVFYVKTRSRQHLSKAVSQTILACRLNMTSSAREHECRFCAMGLREDEKCTVRIAGKEMISQIEEKDLDDEMIFVNSDCVSWKKFNINYSPDKDLKKVITKVPSESNEDVRAVATTAVSHCSSVSSESSLPEADTTTANCVFRYSSRISTTNTSRDVLPFNYIGYPDLCKDNHYLRTGL